MTCDLLIDLVHICCFVGQFISRLDHVGLGQCLGILHMAALSDVEIRGKFSTCKFVHTLTESHISEPLGGHCG
jgi:hypothetical protein